MRLVSTHSAASQVCRRHHPEDLWCLLARRTGSREGKLIALVIRTAFDKLRTGTAAVPGQSVRPTWSGPTMAELIAGEESSEVEFKQSGVGRHPQTGKPQFPSDNIVKTVAALLNSGHGGTLGIGISDDKRIIGLDADFAASGMDIDRYLNAVTSGLISACGTGPVTTRWSN